MAMEDEDGFLGEDKAGVLSNIWARSNLGVMTATMRILTWGFEARCLIHSH